MANRKVSIYKYVRLTSGWRYCKPVTGANNKLKPDWVITPDGKQEHHPEGNYYLNIGGEWVLAGGDAGEAVKAQKRELAVLAARGSQKAVTGDGLQVRA